jgi:hypothetical protein
MSELWVEDIEYHRVNLTKRYELDEEDVIATFGSVEKFQELFDEGDDEAQSYVYEGDYDTDEDWWTANKGGFDIDTNTSWE